MDRFGIFAAWVGIVAFFLAIPMSVLGNILTPKLLSFWATTSLVRKERRIAKLRIDLKLLDACIADSNFQTEQLLKGLRNCVFAAIGLTYVLMIGVGMILTMHAHLDSVQLPIFPIPGPHISLIARFRLVDTLASAISLSTVYFLSKALRFFRTASRRRLVIRHTNTLMELKKLSA